MSDNNHILDVLTREGVLLNVSVRYWRAQKKLKAEDIGLERDNLNDRLISLGHKKLLPRKRSLNLAYRKQGACSVESSTFRFLTDWRVSCRTQSCLK